MYLLNKKMKGINLRSLSVFCMKLVLPTATLGIVLLLLNYLIPSTFISGSLTIILKIKQVTVLCGEILIGIGVYFVVAFAVKLEEARFVLNIITGRIRKILGKFSINLQ
jgi:peptidoglycan biosynthesis protein MviN/MurJ (putative lipid II flippase)